MAAIRVAMAVWTPARYPQCHPEASSRRFPSPQTHHMLLIMAGCAVAGQLASASSSTPSVFATTSRIGRPLAHRSFITKSLTAARRQAAEFAVLPADIDDGAASGCQANAQLERDFGDRISALADQLPAIACCDHRVDVRAGAAVFGQQSPRSPGPAFFVDP